jgi:hypothetical protein
MPCRRHQKWIPAFVGMTLRRIATAESRMMLLWIATAADGCLAMTVPGRRSKPLQVSVKTSICHQT